MAAGVIPIGKHAPGHGRATVDSHKAYPRVEANDLDADLLPFILNADLPWLMTAHILYPTLDPTLPATLSPAVIGSVIRGRLGFKGVLVTDDLAMQALSGEPADLAQRALGAGCYIALYCRGDPDATATLLHACPELEGVAAARFAQSRAEAAWRRGRFDRDALAAERERLLA
jgi:beta-N-acetylhexosaminidase